MCIKYTMYSIYTVLYIQLKSYFKMLSRTGKHKKSVSLGVGCIILIYIYIFQRLFVLQLFFKYIIRTVFK